MFHCAENLLLIHYWDVDQNVMRKFVISNAYQHIARKPRVGHIPIYDDYNSLFGKCDRFNANLIERTSCHKYGGHNRLGDIGHQHNFFRLGLGLGLCRVFYKMYPMPLKCAMIYQETN